MSIDSSSVVVRVGRLGRKRIVETFVDHLAEEHRYEYVTLSPFDPALDLSVHEAQVATWLAHAETDALIPQMGTLDFDTVTLDHTTKQAAIKRLLRWGMRQTDAEQALKILPMITWLKANYTGQTLADFLGIPLAKLQDVDDRYTALATIEATVIADDGYAQDLDA